MFIVIPFSLIKLRYIFQVIHTSNEYEYTWKDNESFIFCITFMYYYSPSATFLMITILFMTSLLIVGSLLILPPTWWSANYENVTLASISTTKVVGQPPLLFILTLGWELIAGTGTLICDWLLGWSASRFFIFLQLIDFGRK